MEKLYITEKLTNIKPYIKNAKKNINTKEVKESINKYWYITPIIIDENNEILAWHTRYFSLKELWHKEAEVLKIIWLDDNKKREFRIIDNKSNEIDAYDRDILRDEIKDLDIDFMQIFFKDLDLQDISINLDLKESKEINLNDIKKTEENINNFTENKKSNIETKTEVTCPHCLETFYL